MSLLALASMGLVASRRRRSLGSLLALVVGAVVLVPMLLLAAMAQAGSADKQPEAVAPMDGVYFITQRFGCTAFVLEPPGGGCPHFHTGVDLARGAGANVLAVLPGTAEVIASNIGYGLHVLIHHPGDMTTLYGHLLAAAVHSGEPVTGGQLIGYEGSSGNSTGPHLHFEVRIGGVAVDPVVTFPKLFFVWPQSATGTSPAANHHEEDT